VKRHICPYSYLCHFPPPLTCGTHILGHLQPPDILLLLPGGHHVIVLTHSHRQRPASGVVAPWGASAPCPRRARQASRWRGLRPFAPLPRRDDAQPLPTYCRWHHRSLGHISTLSTMSPVSLLAAWFASFRCRFLAFILRNTASSVRAGALTTLQCHPCLTPMIVVAAAEELPVLLVGEHFLHQGGDGAADMVV
jgi:hypothetical protein